MSVVREIASPAHYISGHAIDQYMDRVILQECPRYVARLALWRMYYSGHDATPWEMIEFIHKPFSADDTWRISETCYGRFLMLIKRDVLVTLWRLN